MATFEHRALRHEQAGCRCRTGEAANFMGWGDLQSDACRGWLEKVLKHNQGMHWVGRFQIPVLNVSIKDGSTVG